MSGDTFQSLVSVFEFGAKGDGTSDDTGSIQSAVDYANQIGAAVFFPSAVYRVSQILLREGTILQGVSSGSYPDNNAISGASVFARLANTNKDLLLAPDGSNYCRIFDLAIDGNKNNNSSGYGLCVADGASGQEGQIIVSRCYFHDNPSSNVYLGKNRRANSVEDGAFNYSLNGDGITVAGSDNTISGNIIGSNARAGICLGTTGTQNWPAASPANAAAIAHVSNNDIYGNLVGIAVASFSSGCMIAGNGIDRHKRQGITVYSGASNAVVTNIGAVVQGSGNDVLTLRNSGGATLTKVTEGGSLVHSGGGAQLTQPFNHVLGGSSPIAPDAYLVSLPSGRAGTSQIGTRNADGQTAPIAAWLGPDGTTLLGAVDAGGGVHVNGVDGATAGARFAGGTKSGEPTSGSWGAGDFVIDHTGMVRIYTGSGWVASGGSNAGDGGDSGGGATADDTTVPLGDGTVGTPGKSYQASPADHQHPRAYWAPSDQGFVTWTMDIMVATANSILPPPGTLYVVRAHVPIAATAANIVAAVTNAGAGLAAGQCFAGLWNASSGALVGATADQSANWSTAGLMTMPLSGGPVDLTAGDYYIGLYASGTRLPNFARGNNQIGGAFSNAGLSAKFRVASADTGLTGTPPVTLGTLTSANTSWWLAVS